MTPDFDELIGTEGTEEELRELRQVHELLLQATPPPPLARRTSRVPKIRSLIPRSWAIAGLAAAATASAAVGLAIGYGFNQGGSDFRPGFATPMHGVGATAAATALITVGKEDPNGNRSLRMTVHSLPPLPHGRWYELYLTEKGRPAVACGIFRTGRSGAARVTMNAPADLGEYDGWIVTALDSGHPAGVLLTT